MKLAPAVLFFLLCAVAGFAGFGFLVLFATSHHTLERQNQQTLLATNSLIKTLWASELAGLSDFSAKIHSSPLLLGDLLVSPQKLSPRARARLLSLESSANLPSARWQECLPIPSHSPLLMATNHAEGVRFSFKVPVFIEGHCLGQLVYSTSLVARWRQEFQKTLGLNINTLAFEATPHSLTAQMPWGIGETAALIRREAKLFGFGLLLLAIGFTSVAYWFLQRFVLTPLARLAARFQQTRRHLEDGLLAKPALTAEPIVELNELAAAHDGLLTQLAEFKARVELKSRTETLGEQAAQVAHDLQGPLLALETAIDPGNPAHSRQKSRTLQQLFARLRAVTSTVKAHSALPPMKALNALANSEELLATLATECGYRFQFNPEFRVQTTASANEALPAHVCAAQLSCILSNLVANAFDACGGDGWVSVHASTKQDFFQISVEDGGSGFSPHALRRAGERGFTSKGQAGSGLGLWSAKEFCLKHNGRFEVCSTPGRGSKVTLSFPCATARERKHK